MLSNYYLNIFLILNTLLIKALISYIIFLKTYLTKDKSTNQAKNITHISLINNVLLYIVFTNNQKQMIQIYTTPDRINVIQNSINNYPDLSGGVEVIDVLQEAPKPSSYALNVNANGISFPIDWYNLMPPYILPEYVEYSEETLIGIIFSKLGVSENIDAFFSKERTLSQELHIINGLIDGYEFDPNNLNVESYKVFDDYRLMHNNAIIRHYFTEEQDVEKIHYFYNQALDDAPNDEWKAFSAKQYILFLIDQAEYALASKVAHNILSQDISKSARNEVNALLLKLKVDLPEIKLQDDHIEKLTDYYTSTDQMFNLAMVHGDACEIAGKKEDYQEAVDHIDKAINIYKTIEFDDFFYQSNYQKGIILYTWALQGKRHLFRDAMLAFQSASKYFNSNTYPLIHAHIQHYLGIIFSEMLLNVEPKKQGLWAGMSSTAFQEALEIFSKQRFPLEHAMVCNSYGVALTNYPDAVLTDYFEKALFYFNESLQIRTEAYPIERSNTLLNYIQASWHIGNEDENNRERYEDMLAKANEVISLNAGEPFVDQAKEHLEKLNKLAEKIEG